MRQGPDITLEPMAGLVREHERIDEALTEAREVAEAAVRNPGNRAGAAEALEHLRGLQQFLDYHLPLHIAKEEEVLFPALRLDPPMSTTVDELIEQHEQIRQRHAELLAGLLRLDEAHEEVQAQRAQLSQALDAADSPPTPEEMTGLWEAVRRLHWILQGHFGDEEDDLFLPAETLLPAGRLAELERQIAELAACWSAPDRA